MDKNTVDFFLSSGLPQSNIEIGGRGFDLELFPGRKNPSNLSGPSRLLHGVVNISCGSTHSGKLLF